MRFEICVDNMSSIETAVKAQVDRVELCSALAVGGLTPSYGFLKQAMRFSSVEHHVMIRPRAGDFCFAPSEIAMMRDDIQTAKALGAHGVVLGALTANGQIDIKACEQFIQAADGMEVTFHRAFDLCNDAEKALEQIIELGFTRLLTSGQAKTAWLGREKIAQLIAQSRGRIAIMPGAGVTSDNVLDIIRETGASDIHFSAKMKQDKRAHHNGVSMGSQSESDNCLIQTDLNEVLNIKQALINY
ncbi:MAG: copper homeostasis protein CutC [Gammaproteobacteria bacterium]|nr:MAG: copper homeostasis protein CutC [Gammaproteobacteria bacterium]